MEHDPLPNPKASEVIYCDQNCGSYLVCARDRGPSKWTCPECELDAKDAWLAKQAEAVKS